MSIDFTPDRWNRVKEVYSNWWDKKTTAPVVGVIVKCRQPKIKDPKYPLLSQTNCNDLTIAPEQIIDAIEYELARYEFYGDAFPMFSMDCFGPGIIAAMLGAKLDNKTGHVWFTPKEKKEICNLNFTYDPNNIWLQRIKAIYRAGLKRFGGNVLLSMPDIGAPLDILAIFRPGEQLLFDLYDSPEEVIRLIHQLDDLWIKFYEEMAKEMQADQYGYTDWSSIYSQKPSYIVQSDFTYMIGHEMYEQFAFESIKKSCEYLGNAIFHLDGPGELKHLDKLLMIDSLKAVQWVPGDGNPKCDYYINEYIKILDKKKQIQIPGHGFEVMNSIINQTGNPGAYHHTMMYIDESKKDYALNWLKQLKIEI